MDRKYAADGTPLDLLKRNAKRKSKAGNAILADAQKAIAEEKGYGSWAALMADSLCVENDFDVNFCIIRTDQHQETVFDVFDLLDEVAGDLDEFDHITEVMLEKSLSMRSYDHIVYRFNFSYSMPEEETSLKSVWPLEKPLLVCDLISAIHDANDNRPGPLISVLNDTGLFNRRASDHEFRHGELDAVLVYVLKDQPYKITERYLFNVPNSPHRKGYLDYSRRCFIHKLSDGNFVVSNGAEDKESLIYALVSKQDMALALEELEVAFQGNHLKVFESEAWMRDRLLPADDPLTDRSTPSYTFVPDWTDYEDDAWDYLRALDLESAARSAQQALDLNPKAIDAMVILARTQIILPERERLLRKAAEIGREQFSDEIDRAPNDDFHFWGQIETRPFMRALHTLSLHLFRTGSNAQKQEAVEIWELLYRICPNDNLGVRFLLHDFKETGHVEVAPF